MADLTISPPEAVPSPVLDRAVRSVKNVMRLNVLETRTETGKPRHGTSRRRQSAASVTGPAATREFLDCQSSRFRRLASLTMVGAAGNCGVFCVVTLGFFYRFITEHNGML